MRQRAIYYGRGAGFCLFILFLLAGLWVSHGIDGFIVSGVIDHSAPSNPLHKTVNMVAGAWLDNYQANPLLWFAPGLALLAIAMHWLCIGRGESKLSSK